MPHFKNADNKLFWLDDGDDPSIWLPQCTQITDAEANAIRAQEIEDEQAALTYAQKRAAAYPSIADQLDLLYHGGMDTWRAAITAVKEEFPK
jgi:hypothetical protein